jgi:NitT/TauT family transport system substrate-binding protein
VALALVLGACTASTTPEESQSGGESGAPSPASGEASPDEQLPRATLRLDWFISPHHVPFIYAHSKGYYRDAGIDLVILEGRGSLSTSQIIAADADTFGFVAAPTAATGIGSGMSIRMVSDYVQINPAMLIFFCDEGIEEPADLVGKTLATTAGSTPFGDMLPAMMDANGLSIDDIEVVNVDPAARIPALLEGRADMVDGFGYSTLGDVALRAEEAGLGEVCHLDIPEFGISTLGHGVIVNRGTIENRPELITAFLTASNRGWEEVFDDRQAGIDATLEMFPQANPEFLAAGLDVLPDTLFTPNSDGETLGWMAEEDWQQTLEILANYTTFEGSESVGDYYTNDFIP